MLLQTFLGTQISEHLQDALLTKLLDQFLEVNESQFALKTRKLHLRLYCSFFTTAFWKIGV